MLETWNGIPLGLGTHFNLFLYCRIFQQSKATVFSGGAWDCKGAPPSRKSSRPCDVACNAVVELLCNGIADFALAGLSSEGIP